MACWLSILRQGLFSSDNRLSLSSNSPCLLCFLQIIRSPSRSRDRSGNAIPPQTAAAAAVPNHMISSGRGGAGNVRSPSRDPLDRKRAAEAAQREEKLQEEYRQTESRTAHLTGRGGAGNATSDPAAAEERGRGRGSNGSSNGGGGVSGVSTDDG